MKLDPYDKDYQEKVFYRILRRLGLTLLVLIALYICGMISLKNDELRNHQAVLDAQESWRKGSYLLESKPDTGYKKVFPEDTVSDPLQGQIEDAVDDAINRK